MEEIVFLPPSAAWIKFWAFSLHCGAIHRFLAYLALLARHVMMQHHAMMHHDVMMCHSLYIIHCS
jgi:hypothetical protein